MQRVRGLGRIVRKTNSSIATVPRQDFHAPVEQVAANDIHNHHHWVEPQPPDDPGLSRQCPQCRRLTWRYTRHCVHCNLDLVTWSIRTKVLSMKPSKSTWIALAVAAVFVAGCTAARAQGPREVEPLASLPKAIKPLRDKALTGDRQAMKNLGFSYATGTSEMKGMRLPVAGCAWLLAIPWVLPEQFQGVDVSGIYVHCHPLPLEDQELAYRHAAKLAAQIRPTPAKP